MIIAYTYYIIYYIHNIICKNKLDYIRLSAVNSGVSEALPGIRDDSVVFFNVFNTAKKK